jgi:hypothetical protein
MYPLCSNHMQLMCPTAIIGWFEIAALVGAVYLVLACSGAKRRYGLVIAALLALLHFYALLSLQQILGKLHVVSTPYLMFALFPMASPAVIAAGSFAARLTAGGRAAPAWVPAAGAWLIAAAALVIWFQSILPYLPRPAGRGPFRVPPIAHVPVKEGPIVDYLRGHIGLRPGAEFRGYASTFLGATDSLVRQATKTPGDTMTWSAYIAARDLLFDRFGNSFQSIDLWNSGIPTLEEYGQWTSKQMYLFNRDLLADPQQDGVDPLMSSILVYRFWPQLLGALGVRFVIADGTLAEPSVERVAAETGKDGATINLYEIKGANLGQFSPTQSIWVADYPAAVKALREQGDLEHRVILMGDPERQPGLVSASRGRLVAIRDGYHLTAAAPGTAVLVLPVQFSHCWRIENGNGGDAPRIFRANIVQTGILFKDAVNVTLRFDFEPWRPSCRFEDARDLSRFGFK